MEMNLTFPNSVTDAPEDVLAMEDNHRLLESVEFQRGNMVDYLDLINYENGFSFDDPIQTRHRMAYLAMAMPSLAIIDPNKTREMRYNLGLVVDNLLSPHLDLHMAPYNSDAMRLAEHAVACALYRLVSGDDTHDAAFHADVEALNALMWDNLRVQHVCGIDTCRGSFEITPNALALLSFEIHDRLFGSRLLDVCEPMASTLIEPLTDTETGLFRESLRTTSIGYVNERVAKSAQWTTKTLKANVNGLAIVFLNHLDPERCQHAWSAYVDRFMPGLLALSAEDVAAGVGASYTTQLGPGSEDLLAGMLAAREMNDAETFSRLEEHFMQIANPNMWEGHVVCADLGELEAMITDFYLFARIHVSWSKILAHDWENYYNRDYTIVR